MPDEVRFVGQMFGKDYVEYATPVTVRKELCRICGDPLVQCEEDGPPNAYVVAHRKCVRLRLDTNVRS